MSINQILKNEQITLMRHAAETNPVASKKYRRKLNIFLVGRASQFSPAISPGRDTDGKPPGPGLAARFRAWSGRETSGRKTEEGAC